MKRMLSLLLFCLASQAYAGFYKWTDAHGQVHYSDTAPNSPAESVTPNGGNTYMPLPVPKGIFEKPQQQEPPAFSGYKQLLISKPDHESTVQHNGGKLQVKLTPEPALQPKHHYRLYLNNQEQDAKPTDNSFILNGLVRGSYTLRVEIVDDLGDVAISSDINEFYVHQPSAISP